MHLFDSIAVPTVIDIKTILRDALEENLEEENKKIEAEIASASNADEKRDTTVDSNETTESDLEKETATASNGKETPEIKRKM